MNIQEASQEDEKEIKTFSAQEWPSVDAKHFGHGDIVFDKKKYTFVATDAEKVIGYAIIETDMGVCYLDSIITANSYRGSGIGKELMHAVEEKAHAEKCHKMFLETGIDWDARLFYESLGYTAVGTLKNHYDKKDFVYMEKILG
jgi:ribosomal protein S18 acetylase RimI-like enzyme